MFVVLEGTSYKVLGGTNVVKGAIVQIVDAEELGGARTHTAVSAVAHYRAKDDAACLAHIRDYVARLPHAGRPPAPGGKPKRNPKELYDLLPADHRMSYDVRAVLDCVLDAGALDEFQPDIAPEMICGHGAVAVRPGALIAHYRGVIERPHAATKIVGAIFTRSDPTVHSV